MEPPKQGSIITQVIWIGFSYRNGMPVTFSIFFPPVKHLNEDHVYTFQVFSLSNTDYQAGSNEFEILVPPYRRIRAIAIGTTCGLLLILTASAVFLYVKKRCFNPYKDTNEKSWDSILSSSCLFMLKGTTTMHWIFFITFFCPPKTYTKNYVKLRLYNENVN